MSDSTDTPAPPQLSREEWLAKARTLSEALPYMRRYSGRTFVITGTLEAFTRDEVKEQLEALGAKVSGSVSAKTSALIAGAEAGSKLDKATEKGVPVLEEAALVRLLDGASLDDLV